MSMSLNKEQGLDAYRLMMLIRRFEEKCAELYAAGDIGGFLHLYIGQEALAVAAKCALREDDNIITAYRDHGTGLALADQYNGEDRVTMAFTGDGSTNIGYFHEALNLAAVWKLPVVWVVENNQYGMGTAVTRASAVGDIAKKAEAYGMPCCIQVDGMDLLALIDTFKDGIDYARSGQGSYFIEAITYRFRGHSMGDPERYRPVHEVKQKQETDDPITRWGSHLLKKKWASGDDLEAMADDAEREVLEAVEFARSSPLPTQEDLYAEIYVE